MSPLTEYNNKQDNKLKSKQIDKQK